MDEKEFDYMNVIPMVDVMLVLLTIVLTTSTFIATGMIPVELPRASRSPVEILRTQTIEIDRQGATFLNDRQVSHRQLQEALKTVERDRPLLIRADRALPLEGFVEVLDIVKKLGFRTVSLQTEERR